MVKDDLRTEISGDIERQIQLPLKQAFAISMRNVTLRLGRAAVTGAGVVLGIAFLISVGTQRVIDHGIQEYDRQHAGFVGGENALGAQAAAEAAQSDDMKANWLIVMSLLVCGVGITNSLLMSVTERFREIGTMKCLGALDKFIVQLFLMEAAVLGALGSIVGALLGFVSMLLLGCFRHGFDLPAKMDWGNMLAWVGSAIVLGIVISLLAAFWPAWRAAKLPPAAALATEV
ncbi:MAG TPA: FtsX-like permease family protein [Armatimonadota bacterium]|nr:FtsX-like permease family protein [Armatimonadota bacterium]